MEEARTAAQTLLAQRANDSGSGETFVFDSSAEEDGEVVLKYRAHHPDWVIRTHTLVTVAYDPNTKTARFIGR